jgi:transposase
VAEWVESGPNLKTDGVVRWRCADLRDRIAAKFHVHLHERSVGKLLKKLNFSSMSGRPVHPQSDLEAQEAFKKTSPGWRAPQSRRSLPAGRSKSGFRMKPALASKAR